MTQVDHGLTGVNVLDSVINTKDANKKRGASHLLQYTLPGLFNC
jgi:hypothetical protein